MKKLEEFYKDIIENKIIFSIYLGLYLVIFMSIYIFSKRPNLNLEIVYYKTICDFKQTLLIIPCFLVIKSKVVSKFFNYKTLIRFKNIKEWFNIVCKYSCKLTLKYIVIINIFFMFNSLILLNIKSFNKEFIYYFILAVLNQITTFLILAIIYDLIAFISNSIVSLCIVYGVLSIFTLIIKSIFDKMLTPIELIFLIPDFERYNNHNIILIVVFIGIFFIIKKISIPIISKRDILWRK